MKLTESEINEAIALVQQELQNPDLDTGLGNVIDYFTLVSWDRRSEDFRRFYEF